MSGVVGASSTRPAAQRGPQGTLGAPSVFAESVCHSKGPRGKGGSCPVPGQGRVVTDSYRSTKAAAPLGSTRRVFFWGRGPGGGRREGLFGVPRTLKPDFSWSPSWSWLLPFPKFNQMKKLLRSRSWTVVGGGGSVLPGAAAPLRGPYSTAQASSPARLRGRSATWRLAITPRLT